jgi:hypothetical protein
MQQLWRLPAVTAVEMLQKQQVTPLQLVEASEARWKVWSMIPIGMATIYTIVHAMAIAWAVLLLCCCCHPCWCCCVCLHTPGNKPYNQRYAYHLLGASKGKGQAAAAPGQPSQGLPIRQVGWAMVAVGQPIMACMCCFTVNWLALLAATLLIDFL